MATYFSKFKGLKMNMRHTNITDKYVERMIVREPKTKPDNLHPDVKERWNQMTQPPLPLKFKLHELPEKDTSLNKPLGLLETLPFSVSKMHSHNYLLDRKDTQQEPAGVHGLPSWWHEESNCSQKDHGRYQRIERGAR